MLAGIVFFSSPPEKGECLCSFLFFSRSFPEPQRILFEIKFIRVERARMLLVSNPSIHYRVFNTNRIYLRKKRVTKENKLTTIDYRRRKNAQCGTVRGSCLGLVSDSYIPENIWLQYAHKRQSLCSNVGVFRVQRYS